MHNIADKLQNHEKDDNNNQLRYSLPHMAHYTHAAETDRKRIANKNAQPVAKQECFDGGHTYRAPLS